MDKSGFTRLKLGAFNLDVLKSLRRGFAWALLCECTTGRTPVVGNHVKCGTSNHLAAVSHPGSCSSRAACRAKSQHRRAPGTWGSSKRKGNDDNIPQREEVSRAFQPPTWGAVPLGLWALQPGRQGQCLPSGNQALEPGREAPYPGRYDCSTSRWIWEITSQLPPARGSGPSGKDRY